MFDLRKSLLAIGVVAVTATMVSTSARADEKPRVERPVVIEDPVPPGFRSWEEVGTVQERLVGIAERIMAVGAGGLGGIEADMAARRLRVHWKGEVPAAVRAVLTDEVTVDPARFTREELQAEIRRIVAQPDGSGVDIARIAPRTDGSGLVVVVDGSVAAARELPALRTSAVPLSFETGRMAAPVYSRADDMPSYYAGGRWSLWAGKLCTTGFAFTAQASEFLLGAAHCADQPLNAYDGGGQRMGEVFDAPNVELDFLRIEAQVTSHTFVGGPYSGASLPVYDSSINLPGSFLCVGGAFSGEHCDSSVEVDDMWNHVTDGTKDWWIAHQVQAVNWRGLGVVGNGDSGGPVYNYGSGGKVFARGVLSSANSNLQEAPCQGEPTTATRKCSYRFWYGDLNHALALYGGTLQTEHY
ncbi:hypothetical protein Acor_43230 [Acrocarpospora corrugata]|uniref:Peptidase S1 domain-containing protein n=1 Tax=Acrocarpospora corrugata TaxID=35763 RepID=A0A5M3W6P3_9ACTN|nr:hypothetical protein [Acrocarpospora corrugata]GES02258.1 hypothetical protein Acor_43230 [Acrocarpospora corrugata]